MVEYTKPITVLFFAKISLISWHKKTFQVFKTWKVFLCHEIRLIFAKNKTVMGLVYSTIKLSNPIQQELQPIEVACLADTGSTYLCIPSHIAMQLNLKTLETREATLADGSSHQVPYVGPVKINFENRNCFVGALVLYEV